MSISEPSCPAEEQASGNAAGKVNTTQGCSLPHKNVAVHKHYSGPRLTQNKNKCFFHPLAHFLCLCCFVSLQWQWWKSGWYQQCTSCSRNNATNLHSCLNRRGVTAMLSAVMYVTFTQCCEEGFAPPLLIPYFFFAYLSHLIVFQIIK